MSMGNFHTFVVTYEAGMYIWVVASFNMTKSEIGKRKIRKRVLLYYHMEITCEKSLIVLPVSRIDVHI
jgi:hypothetical protein